MWLQLSKPDEPEYNFLFQTI